MSPIGATICHMNAEHRLDMGVIGKRILDRREEKRLDQSELAERAGFSRAYISRLERGIVPNPKVLDLTQVAQALDLSMADLVRPDTPPSERHISECTDLMGQLDSEPPEVVETVLRWWRESIQFAKSRSRAG